MRVSPLDIRKQEFSRGFRGYEMEEVQAFLQMLSQEWEQMRDEQRRLEEQLRGMEDKIRHYERVEEALQEALQTARDSTRRTVQNAEEKARNIVRAAEAKADEIQGEAVALRDRLRDENARLLDRQHEIVARLRAFLSAEIEMIERYEKNQLVGSESSGGAQRSATASSSRPLEREQDEWDDRRARHRTTSFSDEVSEGEDDVDERDDEFDFSVRSIIDAGAQGGGDEEHPQPHDDAFGEEARPDDDAGYDSRIEEEERELTKARQATEEIEKIRRILNDLD